MEESPRSFTGRTSIAYAPPERVTFLARPLAPDERCPTLFRYPGPCGLADWFAGTMTRLGPDSTHRLLWLADRPLWRDVEGARHFGTLAVLAPLRFQVGAHGPGVWLGANEALGPVERESVVWVPPSAFAGAIPWGSIGSAAAARPFLPPDLASERHRAIDALCRYLEELDGLRRAGAPGPGLPWCQVPRAERLRLLADHGLRAVWTDSPAARAAA
jgi:hypothetical protein